MRLVVLVPSQEYLMSAGARIRYGRLADALRDKQVELELRSIADFDASAGDYDALVISKCHDARSVLAAATARIAGRSVGVDLFDDYFSQSTDSRLYRYREWLAAILVDCNFCLCSTEAMAAVARRYDPSVAAHVVNDPANEHDVEDTLRLADDKAEEARQTNLIRAVWFGVGDNPYFNVGLADLYAHSSSLKELARSGMAIDLTILTNRRALQVEGLELIARLPIRSTVLEWSQEVERDVLERSLVAFLPVADQKFSTAKSLNRAFTAMSFGCQVLSAGYPLYAALEPLIYRNPGDLLTDLESRQLRLSNKYAQEYRLQLQVLGTAQVEADRLATFLKGLSPSLDIDHSRLCVVHGLTTRAEVHHMAHRVGALSVASPFCSAKLDFDVSFPGLVEEMMAGAGRTAVSHPHSKWLPKPNVSSLPFPYELATYSTCMRMVAERLEAMFGPVRIILSETSRAPVIAAIEG